MPRLALVTAVLLLLSVAAGDADPGHAPAVVDIADHRFRPATLTVEVGHDVFWAWSGPDTNHTVTSDDGQAMTFDSDEGTAPALVSHPVNDVYSVRFAKPGTYGYHCRVHPSMTGKVVVVKIGATPTTTPRLSRVRVVAARRAVVVRYTLSEPAGIRAVIRRLKGSRPAGPALARVAFGSPPGAGRRRIVLADPRPGRYQLALVAVDSSSGRAAKAVRRPFTLR